MHPLIIEPRIVFVALFLICVGVGMLRYMLRIASGPKNNHKLFAIDLGDKYKLPNLLTLIGMILFFGTGILEGLTACLNSMGMFISPEDNHAEGVIFATCLGSSFLLFYLSIAIGWRVSSKRGEESSASISAKR